MSRQIPWLRVGAEGVAIVVSILLAFGIQAGWESMQDRQSERRALQLIRGDLLGDTVDLAGSALYAEGHVASTRWLMERWDDPDVDLDSVSAALGRLITDYVLQPQRAAYVGLRDTNGLVLIQDDSLRAATLRYFEDTQLFWTESAHRTDESRARLLDLLSPHLRWLNTARDGEGRRVATVLLVSPWTEIRRDNRIVFHVSALRANSGRTLAVVRNAADANTELRDMIEAALARR